MWEGGDRNAYRIFVGKTEEKRSLENLGVDWRIIFNWIRNIMG
jgi:hypothetical protein